MLNTTTLVDSSLIAALRDHLQISRRNTSVDLTTTSTTNTDSTSVAPNTPNNTPYRSSRHVTPSHRLEPSTPSRRDYLTTPDNLGSSKSRRKSSTVKKRRRRSQSQMSSSERQPLLANGQLPGRRDIRGAVDAVDNAIPKEKRIKAAQVLGAVEAGKLPSQDQISKLLSVILNSDTLKSGGGASSRTARIGPDGQRVLEDTKNVIKAVKNWGEEKNDNDLLQNFFYNASTADVDVDVDIKTPKLASKDEMSKDAQRAIASLRTLASLLVTSSNFRQLASDAILVSRDILADNTIALADQAKSAAKDVKPTEKERKEGFDFEATQKKGKKVAKGLASGRIQGEIKESIWDEVEDLKDWVEEKLPEGEEAKEKVIAKLQSVVEQAQSNPEYKRSLTAIFNIFKKYGQKAQTALDETKADAKISDEDEKVQQAGRDLRAFVEKLSGKSLDGVISAAQKAIEDVKDDEKLSLYFSDLETYLQRVLYSPGYATSRAAYRKASSLYDDAQSLVKENSQWKEDSTKLQNELQELVDGLTHDKATTQLVESLEDLTKSLAGAGKAGFSSLKAEGQGLYRDVVDVLVPRLIGLVKEIPIPRIEFKSEDFDLVIDDVKLESASFIPDNIRIVQHNDLQFTQGYATYASEYDATLKLRVSGVHFAASNIAFWVSKKTGFAPFEDAGLLDVTFGEKGISFDVTLENADEDNDRETFFKVKDVNVSLSDFDFQVRENDKWISTWFARPIIKAFVKRNLVHAIEIQISEQLRTADFKLYGFQQRVIAATNAKPTAANFVNAIVRDSIFPQRDTSGPVKIKQTGVVKYGRRGEFVLHVGVDEELFPDKPPARVSNTQRQKAKARAGQAGNAAKAVRGSAQQVKKGAEDASNKVKAEGRDLDAKRREQERRDSKKEGWRSEAFDV